jgi:hypothetical protein
MHLRLLRQKRLFEDIFYGSDISVTVKVTITVTVWQHENNIFVMQG